MPRERILLGGLLCGLLLAGTATAAIVTWTNTAGGKWSTPANWSPQQMPGAEDTAVITRAGTYTVTLDVDPTIAGLNLGGDSGTQTVATGGRRLVLNGAGDIGAQGRLLLSGGALSGTGQWRLAGALSWENGSIDANAAVTVAVGGRVTLASAGNRTKSLFGSLTNGGTVLWQPNGYFDVGGTFHNLAGGVFEIQEDNIPLRPSGDSALILNQGTIRKSAGSGTVTVQVPLVQYGALEVLGGTLVIERDCGFHSGSVVLGPAQTRLTSGTHTVDGDLTVTNLVLEGATLVGEATLHGTMVWSSGTIGSGATLTVAPDGELRIWSVGNTFKNLDGNLMNAGTIAWQPYGNLVIGGTLHNLPGALFDIQLANRAITSSGSGGVFLNDGILRKSTSDQPVSCSVPLVNRGRLELLAGTLSFSGTCTNADGSIVLNGGALQTSKPLQLAGGLLSGWGTVWGDVANAMGTVSPARTNGGLTVQGDYAQRVGGILELALGGTTPGTNQSRLRITGKVQLGGTVAARCVADYLPDPGTSFEVLTYESRTGDFDFSDGFYFLGQDRRLTTIHAAKSTSLLTVAAADPEAVPWALRVTGNAALVVWPSEFAGARLYFKANLGEPTWTLIPDLGGRYLESPLAPEKYFYLAWP